MPRPRLAPGLLVAGALAIVATALAALPALRAVSVSPLIAAIALGIGIANLWPRPLPLAWLPGLTFAARRLLRLGIVLYGFRISVQAIAAVGVPGVAMSVLMVVSTLLAGAWLGRRVLGLDRDTALLTAAGSAVCGAAAVLAMEATLRAAPHKTALAVATVVVFGTTSMFLMPALYHSGLLPGDAALWGVYIGGSVHEVAQVVAAGSAIGAATAAAAVVVKMTRVVLLVPVLGAVALVRGGGRVRLADVPWFALAFLAVIAINSAWPLPAAWLARVNAADTFLLAAAMGALGLETRIERLRAAGGGRAFALAAVLFVWLAAGGYVLASLLV